MSRRVERGSASARIGVASVFAALLATMLTTMLATMAVAHADVVFPKDFGHPAQDLKDQIKDPKKAIKDELDEAKKRAKNAIDDALDGGLREDAGLDAGKPDAGDRGDSGDDPVAEDRDQAEREKTRADRARRSRDVLRAVLAEKAPGKAADDALRSELRGHAKRIAWLDRIGALAYGARDDESQGRVKKLLELEFARHDAWLKTWATEGARR